MKPRLVVVFLLAVSLPIALAGEPEKPKEDLSKGTHGANVSEETKQAVQAQMMADMAPGPQHKLLESLAGSWQCTTTHWMDPAQPTKIEHTLNASMILGGRFLKIENKGEFFGMPFEALSIMGYDRRHEHYTIVGYDTFGTYYVAGEGNLDEAGKVLKMSGTTHDPKTGATERYHFVYRDLTPDAYVAEVWFMTPEDKELKMVETVLKRVK